MYLIVKMEELCQDKEQDLYLNYRVNIHNNFETFHHLSKNWKYLDFDGHVHILSIFCSCTKLNVSSLEASPNSIHLSGCLGLSGHINISLDVLLNNYLKETTAVNCLLLWPLIQLTVDCESIHFRLLVLKNRKCLYMINYSNYYNYAWCSNSKSMLNQLNKRLFNNVNFLSSFSKEGIKP